MVFIIKADKFHWAASPNSKSVFFGITENQSIHYWMKKNNVAMCIIQLIPMKKKKIYGICICLWKNQIKNEIKEKRRGGGCSTNRFTFELFELLENMQISTNGGLGRISTPRMRLSQRYQEIITVAACKWCVT